MDAWRRDPGLRAFMARAFAACADEAQKDAVRGALLAFLNRCVRDGTIATRDWAAAPLPPRVAALVARGLDAAQRAPASMRRRAERFGGSPAAPPVRQQEERALRARVVGTSEALEKPYLRLTAAPDPATVRPPRVLARALEHVRAQHAADGDYARALEQFKSIRQDLTVQGVRGALAVAVYEHCARTALAAGDFGEYNQCQAQLFPLYAEASSTAATASSTAAATAAAEPKRKKQRRDEDRNENENEAEFRAYRLLFLRMSGDHEALAHALREELAVPAGRRAGAVDAALALVRAVDTRAYTAYFARARQFPHAAARPVLRELTRAVRDSAVRAAFSAFRPTVPLAVLQPMLGFRRAAACRTFLATHYGVVFVEALCSTSTLSTPARRARKTGGRAIVVTETAECADVARSLPSILATLPPTPAFKVF